MVPQSHLSTTKEIGFKNANLRWGGTGGGVLVVSDQAPIACQT